MTTTESREHLLEGGAGQETTTNTDRNDYESGKCLIEKVVFKNILRPEGDMTDTFEDRIFT